MESALLNIDAYLHRIKYTGKPQVCFETLNNLHILHVLNIPFENLDVIMGRPILLDRESLFKKIVYDNRGGYCFEMNGLFAFVLQELGFKVINLLARVSTDHENYGPKTHQVLLVSINKQKWLVDVGFGNGGLISPLSLEAGIVHQQFFETFRLISDQMFRFVLQRKIGNEFRNLYAFTLEECLPVDYIMSNYFASTFPNRLLTTMKISTKPTREGRVTLTDMCLKITSNGQTSERELLSRAEYNDILQEYFGINMDSGILGELK